MYEMKEINDILNLKGANGEQIDIFDLHFVLFMGNAEGRKWNVGNDGRYTMFAEHRIYIDQFRFDLCDTPEEVKEEFDRAVYEAMKGSLGW